MKKIFHLCGWIFQLMTLVFSDKGIIILFDRTIRSQDGFLHNSLILLIVYAIFIFPFLTLKEMQNGATP